MNYTSGIKYTVQLAPQSFPSDNWHLTLENEKKKSRNISHGNGIPSKSQHLPPLKFTPREDRQSHMRRMMMIMMMMMMLKEQWSLVGSSIDTPNLHVLRLFEQGLGSSHV